MLRTVLFFLGMLVSFCTLCAWCCCTVGARSEADELGEPPRTM